MARLLEGSLEDNVLTMLSWSDQAPQLAMQLDASLFSTREYQRVAATALAHIAQYGVAPRGHLRDELEDEVRRNSFLKRILNAMEILAPKLQVSVIQEQLDHFIAKRRMVLQLESAYDALDREDLPGARQALIQVNDGHQYGPLPHIDWVEYEAETEPPREWIAEGWIPTRTVCSLYGQGGVGKSLLVQQLQTATGLGRPWIGIPVQQVKSYGLYCEDDAGEMKRRQDAIDRLYNCTPQDIARYVRTIPWSGDSVLGVFERGRFRLTSFYYRFREDVLRFGARLVILDTLADCFTGDHNDPTQARHFVQIALKPLALEMDGSVLFCAHPSQHGQESGTGEYGSVQWNAVVRTRSYLTTPKAVNGEEPDANERVFTRPKANYAARDAKVVLYWNDGVLAVKGGADDERPDVRAVFMELLDQVTAEGRQVSAKPNAGNYAPRVFGGHPNRKGWRKNDLEQAMNGLFGEGWIVQIDTKKGTRIIRNPGRQTGEKDALLGSLPGASSVPSPVHCPGVGVLRTPQTPGLGDRGRSGVLAGSVKSDDTEQADDTPSLAGQGIGGSSQSNQQPSPGSASRARADEVVTSATTA
jgi:hypothetical protein